MIGKVSYNSLPLRSTVIVGLAKRDRQLPDIKSIKSNLASFASNSSYKNQEVAADRFIDTA